MELLEYSHQEGASLFIWGILLLNIAVWFLWILPAAEVGTELVNSQSQS